MPFRKLSTEKEIQSAYFGNEVAAYYVAKRFDSELHRLLHEKQVAAVNSVMQSKRPTRSLEIAPGPGRVTRDVQPYNELICLEYNVGMIEQGRAECGKTSTWIQGNAFDLPFNKEFDFVYSFRFIRHFKLKERSRLYEQIRNILRPEGVLLFDAVGEQISKPLRETRPENYPIYDALYRRNDLIDELKSFGFTDIRLKPVQKFFHWQYQSQILLGPRIKWLNRTIIRSLERIPRHEGLEWIVKCRLA